MPLTLYICGCGTKNRIKEKKHVATGNNCTNCKAVIREGTAKFNAPRSKHQAGGGLGLFGALFRNALMGYPPRRPGPRGIRITDSYGTPDTVSFEDPNVELRPAKDVGGK